MAAAASHSDRRNDALLAVAVFLLSLGLLAASASNHGGVDSPGVLVALTALTSLPLVALRAAPLSVFVVTGIASAVLRAVAEPAGPPLGPTVALYFLAADSQSRSHARLTLTLAAALLAAQVVAMGVQDGGFPGTPIAFGVVVWGAAWLAGDRARLRRERIAELEQRALRAEREAEHERRLAAAEERTRIARDLHDSAGHAINVILVHAGLGRLRAEHDPGARETFQTIEEVARQTVTDIDQLVAALREDGAEPDVEPPPGLSALATLTARHRAAGLDVATTQHGDRPALPPSVDRGAYRILQEALTNAARHGTGSAEIDIAADRHTLEITVTNPIRPDHPAGDARGGHGLIGMRERVTLLGGSLDATVRNRRFCVRARLPISAGRS